MKNYISLLVHENIPVILNQVSNFNKYCPNIIVVIHLSATAKFKIPDLLNRLEIDGFTNAIINPVQVETEWGSIIKAHIENIKYIETFNNADKIIFHSSNDMLINYGLEDYLKLVKNGFHAREILVNSSWLTGVKASQDSNFIELLGNNGKIYGSQVEGSFYEANLLFKIIRWISLNEIDFSIRNYAFEEVLFPTIAVFMNVTPNGLPYIFSEVQMIDRFSWKIKELLNIIIPNSSLQKSFMRLISALIRRCNLYKINIHFIILILNKKLNSSLLHQNDSGYIYKLYDPNNIYGVKRVDRNIDSFIRIYINNLN